MFNEHRLLRMSPRHGPSSSPTESEQPHPDQIREALLELSSNPQLAPTVAAARITEASGDLNAQRASLQRLVLQGAESLLNVANRSPTQVQEQFSSIANLTITGDAPPYTVTFEGWAVNETETFTETLLTDNAPEAHRRGHEYLMSNVTPGPSILRNQIEAGEVYHVYSLSRNLGQPAHFGNVQVEYRFYNNQWQHRIVTTGSMPPPPQSTVWRPVDENIFPVPTAGSNFVPQWFIIPAVELTPTEAASRRAVRSISDQLAEYNS